MHAAPCDHARVQDIPIVPVSRLDMRFERVAWPFAAERRAEIDAHFETLHAAKPELWNGRVLLLRHGTLAGGVFSGAYLETDFASMIAWRDWGFPDTTIRNCFPMAALRSSDGAFLLGVMAPYTATAGQIYFAAGTPDPSDVVGDRVDLESGVMRELAEETGLGPSDVTPEPGWFATPLGQRIALMKIMQARETAGVLHERVRTFLESQQQPELAGIHVARSTHDLRPAMPPYVAAFLRSRLG